MDNETTSGEIANDLTQEGITRPEGAAPGEASKKLPFPERREAPGVVRDDSLAEAGRKVLLFHFAEMLANEAGTHKGEDIEALHDMRVATRRMRAAFELFQEAYKPKTIQRLLKGLRKTGRALGAVRDIDVLIENGRKYADGLPKNERKGLDPLLEDWQTQREQRRITMISYLDSSDYTRFKKVMNRFVQTPGAGIPTNGEQTVSPLQIKDIAPMLLYKRVSEVQAYEPLLPAATLDQLHALRIEFKKLRYAAEFLREPLGPEIKQVIQALKQVQDHLGELNDTRVAGGILTEYLQTWEAREMLYPIRDRHSAEPVAKYLASRYAEGFRLMSTFTETWNVFAGTDFRQALAASIAAL